MLNRNQAAYKAGVTVEVIDSWRWRGWIDKEGHRRKLTVVKQGRTPVFIVAEVMQAERDTRSKSERSHRRLDPPSLAA